MQLFQINAMNVSRDDFKRELEKNGLKYGYIPRLYEKFKQGEMTCFRLMIKDYQFVVLTDDESSYPEIQEETGKKIEIEPYSLEWLEKLIYDSNILGPSFYESLLRHLQTYYHVKKAEQRDENEKQKKCPYCDEQLLAYEIGADAIKGPICVTTEILGTKSTRTYKPFDPRYNLE